ncbi:MULTISPECIES: hypothetical protein [Paenibacillus]|uniref:Uncharacterized protein n=1 Tax=Paenibacillus borealis TaxID=160799 RepID=A0ABX3H3I8_PAEBO|nr:hypothetical protein [Paenibacillus borealis]OMD41618.1 hypothetical protein BSK56_26930 [Paenibacillus borealis]
MSNRKPFFTLLLILSCLISTGPQFILPDLYNTITGQVPSWHSTDGIAGHGASEIAWEFRY